MHLCSIYKEIRFHRLVTWIHALVHSSVVLRSLEGLFCQGTINVTFMNSLVMEGILSCLASSNYVKITDTGFKSCGQCP